MRPLCSPAPLRSGGDVVHFLLVCQAHTGTVFNAVWCLCRAVRALSNYMFHEAQRMAKVRGGGQQRMLLAEPLRATCLSHALRLVPAGEPGLWYLRHQHVKRAAG